MSVAVEVYRRRHAAPECLGTLNAMPILNWSRRLTIADGIAD